MAIIWDPTGGDSGYGGWIDTNPVATQTVWDPTAGVGGAGDWVGATSSGTTVPYAFDPNKLTASGMSAVDVWGAYNNAVSNGWGQQSDAGDGRTDYTPGFNTMQTWFNTLSPAEQQNLNYQLSLANDNGWSAFAGALGLAALPMAGAYLSGALDPSLIGTGGLSGGSAFPALDAAGGASTAATVGDTIPPNWYAAAGTSDVAPGGVIGAGGGAGAAGTTGAGILATDAAGVPLAAPYAAGTAGTDYLAAAGLPSFTDAAGSFATGTGVMADGTAAALTGNTILDKILGGIGNLTLGNVIGGIGEAATQSGYANDLNSLMDKAINADQWRTQQPRYFDPLYNATTQGIGNTPYGQSILQSAFRNSAAKGYNGSGNFMIDAAKALNSGTTDYIRAVTPLATGRAPDTSAISQFGQSAAKASNQGVMGSLGTIYNAAFPSGGPTLSNIYNYTFS